MANWCSNFVVFTGEDLTRIHQFMDEAIKENNRGFGWSRHDGGRCMFNVYHQQDGVYSFESKWSPPLTELEELCREAMVSCVCDYEEGGVGIYGQFTYDYETDSVATIDLDDADLDRVQYNEEDDIYTFDGEVIDSRYDAYEQMIDEKRGGGL